MLTQLKNRHLRTWWCCKMTRHKRAGVYFGFHRQTVKSLTQVSRTENGAHMGRVSCNHPVRKAAASARALGYTQYTHKMASFFFSSSFDFFSFLYLLACTCLYLFCFLNLCMRIKKVCTAVNICTCNNLFVCMFYGSTYDINVIL